MDYPFPIDKKATRSAVVQRLASARMYKKLGFVRLEMRTTTSLEPRYHGPTNVVGKPAEAAAIYNVDTEKRTKEDYEMLELAVSRLCRTERHLIELRYLEDDEVFDYNVYSELNLSERKYYRVKSNAIDKLAYALGLEQYLEDTDER